jgi:hypothetical protein
MLVDKFGGIQRLKAAYRDGRLSALEAAWFEVMPCWLTDEEMDALGAQTAN